MEQQQFVATSGAGSGPAPRATGPATDFEVEVTHYLPSLRRTAARLCRCVDDAEDLVSATLLRAMVNWHRFIPGTNAGAWMQTILRRIFLDERRRSARFDTRPTGGSTEPAMDDLVGEADPEGRFYDSFVDEGVVEALQHLPPEYRGAVILSDLEAHHYAEVAEILGVPEGTVKSRLFRGRRILRQRLRGYAVEMGYVGA